MTLQEKYEHAVEALRVIASYKTLPAWKPPKGSVASGDAAGDLATVAVNALDDLGEWR